MPGPRAVAVPVLDRRRAGILLHPTSLPYAPQEGALGRQAYHFVDFLRSAAQSVWQVLPLHPPHVDRSPYNACSAFAGNPGLVSLELAAQWGWLKRAPAAADAADPSALQAWLKGLGSGFRHNAHADDLARYQDFCVAQADWLDDYALFAVLRSELGGPWYEWPPPLRDRDAMALAAARTRYAADIEVQRVLQFAFFRQWLALRDYAREHGVHLFGDIPIFVAHDSADVWTWRNLFKIDSGGRPTVEAGCPPDYYSATGQRWGNPLYDWPRMQADGFRWWQRRLQVQMDLFDLVRIDHFRGFVACWEIEADAATAAEGAWVSAPGEALFDALSAAFGTLPVVAEDLGVITPEVRTLRGRYGLPGMRVLHFGFDGSPHNPHLVHEHVANAVVYTGTHDNDTTLGWYASLPEAVRRHVLDYLGGQAADIPWPVIRLALASVCRLAILPMQDVLGLDSPCRMNTPGTMTGNWQWRFDWAQVTPAIVNRLRHLTHLYGRA